MPRPRPAAKHRRPDVVVKLGGSLLGSPHLAPWLDLLARCAGAGVAVAGGGPFADAVREAQRRRSFSDAAAHRIAILAMEQYAHLLAALAPGLRLAATAAEIAAACRAGATPLWLPSRMTFGAPDIPESWEATSDSLALWLAHRLGIPRVVLVKSAPLPTGVAGAASLAAAGIVDPLVPRFLARMGVQCRCIEAGDAAAYGKALAGGTDAGTLLAADG